MENNNGVIVGTPDTEGVYVGIVEPGSVKTETYPSKKEGGKDYKKTEMIIRMMHEGRGAKVQGRFKVWLPFEDGILVGNTTEPQILSVSRNERGYPEINRLGTLAEFKDMVEKLGL